MQQRLCEYCGEEYLPRTPGSKCHSQNPDCQRQHKNAQRLRAYNDAIAARPKPETVTCEYCGEDYVPTRPYSKCHSQSRECALKYKNEHRRPIKNRTYHARKGPPKRQLSECYLDLHSPMGFAREVAFRKGYKYLLQCHYEDTHQQLACTLLELGIDPTRPNNQVEVGRVRRTIRRDLYRFTLQYGLARHREKAKPDCFTEVPLEELDRGTLLRHWVTTWRTA